MVVTQDLKETKNELSQRLKSLRRKMIISEVSEFSILPYTKIENSEIWEICLLLQISTVVIAKEVLYLR